MAPLVPPSPAVAHNRASAAAALVSLMMLVLIAGCASFPFLPSPFPSFRVAQCVCMCHACAVPSPLLAWRHPVAMVLICFRVATAAPRGNPRAARAHIQTTHHNCAFCAPPAPSRRCTATTARCAGCADLARARVPPATAVCRAPRAIPAQMREMLHFRARRGGGPLSARAPARHVPPGMRAPPPPRRRCPALLACMRRQ